MAIDKLTVVNDGTLEFTNFNIVEQATTGDEAGLSTGSVSGSPVDEGLNFTDLTAFASGPNSRVDARISYKVTQADPLTAIQQIGAQFNMAVDIEGQNVEFGAGGPSQSLRDIEAWMVHSVYTVNEDGSKGELVGSLTLNIREPDFRDPPYETGDFQLNGAHRELLVESRVVLDTNTTDAKLTLSVIGNSYNSDAAPGSLSGTYFCDEDHDGVDDGAANGDVDIAGKKVELFEADGVTPVTDFDGNPVAPVTTDANGNYRFDNLKPGDYVVKFEDSEAEGKSFIDQNVGDDDTIDSDANPSTGVTAPVKVFAGEETPNVDVGVEKTDPVDPGTASLGDTVWYDTNKNGVLDAGETGAAGVTVELTGAGEDGVFGNADDITRTTTTDANGKYLFDNLDAGDYKVTFGKPDGYEYTTASTAGAQDVNNDSDAGVNGMTDIINIEIGEAERDVDAGLVKDEPVDPGTASLGDTVWYDTNKNGVLDAGETGAAGVTVELTGAGEDGVFGNADDITRTTTTDANGKYLFDNLDAGDYKVTFGKPDGYEYTTASTAGAQDVNNDSDAGVNGMTDIINIEIGEAERDVDAGLVTTAPEGQEICAKVVFSKAGTSGRELLNSTRSVFEGAERLKVAVLLDKPVSETTTFQLSLRDSTATYGSDYWFDGAGKQRTVTVTVEAGETIGYASERIVLYNEGLNVPGDSGTERFYVDLKNPSGNDIDQFKCLDRATVNIYETDTDSPVAFDLNKDGQIGVTGATTARDKSGLQVADKTVSFDIDADGEMDQIEWLSGDGDAFLFDNRDGNAINDMNGSRLFGDANGHDNGYEKLAELDADGDGMLQGVELEGLQLWADNGDAVMTEDEIVLLSDVGVVAISSEMELVKDEDGRDLMQSVAQLANGEFMLTEDVWFLAA